VRPGDHERALQEFYRRGEEIPICHNRIHFTSHPVIAVAASDEEANCVLTTGTVQTANQLKNKLAMIEEIKLMPKTARNGRPVVCHHIAP